MNRIARKERIAVEARAFCGACEIHHHRCNVEGDFAGCKPGMVEVPELIVTVEFGDQ